MNHSPEINKLLQEYALRPEIQQQGGTASAAYRGLEHMLATSPMLERMLQEAASRYTNAQGQPLLRHLDVLSAGNSSGAEYKEGTLYLSAADLSDALHSKKNMYGQVFLTAHEIQHSFQADRLQQARESVSTEIGHIARSPAAVHDYTAPLQRLQATDANDEARAAPAGWNLMVGHMRRARRTVRYLAAAFLACSLAACANGFSSSPATVPAMSHSAASPTAHANPPTTAEQALRTMLRMIDSVHGPKDMTPEKFMQVTGVELKYTPDKESPDYTWSRQVAPNWWVSIRFSWQRIGSTKGEDAIVFLDFAQWPSASLQRFPMTDVCQMDLQQFDAELKKIGFKHIRHMSQAGVHEHSYERGKVYVDVAYAGESQNNASHDCIRRVYMGLLREWKQP